jgi:hypothetical protein
MGENTKCEATNSKYECRNSKQIRNSKIEIRNGGMASRASERGRAEIQERALAISSGDYQESRLARRRGDAENAAARGISAGRRDDEEFPTE